MEKWSDKFEFYVILNKKIHTHYLNKILILSQSIYQSVKKQS